MVYRLPRHFVVEECAALGSTPGECVVGSLGADSMLLALEIYRVPVCDGFSVPSLDQRAFDEAGYLRISGELSDRAQLVYLQRLESLDWHMGSRICTLNQSSRRRSVCEP